MISRALRWHIADTVMCHIDDHGAPTREEDECAMTVGGVEFLHTYARDPNGGISLHDLSLETKSWKLVGTVGPNYLAVEVSDAELCDRDLMALLLSGAVEPKNLDKADLEETEALIQKSIIDPPWWAKSRLTRDVEI